MKISQVDDDDRSVASHAVVVDAPVYVITTCASCGAALKEYKHLLKDDPEYRERAEKLRGSEFRMLLSDQAIVEIFDCVVEGHREKGGLKTSEIMDKLNGEPAKGLLREIMLSRPICSVDMLEHVLQEYEKRINERKLRASAGKARAKGDLEAAQNRILYLRKQEKESGIQRD